MREPCRTQIGPDFASRPDPNWSRRDFVTATGGCVAHLMALGVPSGALLGAPPNQESARRLAGRSLAVVADEPWGRLYRIAEGVYALISDPLAPDGAGRFTLCNGGFVAGSNGVLMVEAFGSPEGATWMADQAERLTGQRPTHQLVTHYHLDHTGGLGGIEDVEILSTARTRALIAQDGEQNEAVAGRPLPEARLDAMGGQNLDLGGITARLSSRDGHTPSDVTVEVTSGAGQRSVFCGDLVWKDMFPNFVDALPGRLNQSVRSIGAEEGVVYVSGHGDLADAADMRRYLAVLEDVEAHARAGIEAGTPLAEAAAAYQVPAEFGEWFRFSATYHERAFGAWYRSMGVGS